MHAQFCSFHAAPTIDHYSYNSIILQLKLPINSKLCMLHAVMHK